MALAACLRCGKLKRSPLIRCRSCGYDPRADTPAAQATSIFLSTLYMHPDTEEYRTPREVRELAARIARGEGISVERDVIESLLAEKRALEAYPVPWWKVVVFVLVCLLPVLITIALMCLFR